MRYRICRRSIWPTCGKSSKTALASIGKVGIRLLLERLDNDDMDAVKMVHDFTGWMLEFKAETAPMSKQLLSGGVFTNEHNRYNG